MFLKLSPVARHIWMEDLFTVVCVLAAALDRVCNRAAADMRSSRQLQHSQSAAGVPAVCLHACACCLIVHRCLLFPCMHVSAVCLYTDVCCLFVHRCLLFDCTRVSVVCVHTSGTQAAAFRCHYLPPSRGSQRPGVCTTWLPGAAQCGSVPCRLLGSGHHWRHAYLKGNTSGSLLWWCGGVMGC